MLVLGLGLRGLALTKNSRPKSWQTTKFTINFHRLEHSDWSELYFKIHVPYLLIVGNHGLVRVLEKQDFITFFRNQLHYGMALALSVLALFTSLLFLWSTVYNLLVQVNNMLIGEYSGRLAQLLHNCCSPH